MNQIEMELSSFRNELKVIKAKLSQIEFPFKFMYRPPREEKHKNICQYLDSIDERLCRLEELNGITSDTESTRS